MKRLADNNIEEEGFLNLVVATNNKFQKENIFQYVDDDGDDLTAEDLINGNQIFAEVESTAVVASPPASVSLSGPCAICYENPMVMLMLPCKMLVSCEPCFKEYQKTLEVENRRRATKGDPPLPLKCPACNVETTSTFKIFSP